MQNNLDLSLLFFYWISNSNLFEHHAEFENNDFLN